MKPKLILTVLITSLLGHPLHAEPVAPVVPIKVKPFALNQVRLLDGPFKKATEINKAYLLKVEPDRMLWPFHQYAGLPTKGERYGGWAKKDCVGHEAGHYLSALALMYASTGDAEMKKRADYMVSEIARVQEKHGDGYAGPVRLEVWKMAFSGDIKADAWGMCGGYVPWYVMHKVYAGLIDAHVLTGNKQALEVVTKFADWAKKGTDNLTEEQFQKMLACEFGGMVESLSELYALTGKKDYLTLARRFDHKAITDPLAAKQDILTGKHVNTNLPKILGAARLYELDGQQRDATIANFLWDSMVDSRTFAPGGMDVRERYIAAGQESKQLATNASESCVVYNTLKLTRQLFGWQPDARYMDYYERGLYNTILSSQDPKSGGYTYFNSMKPGHFKIYSSPEDAMWCCVGTGMENHSKYADTIYSRDAESLWVNLFIPSELNWQEKGLTVRQETEFPVKDTTTLKIGTKQAQKLSVKIRVPYWAAKAPEITVNGEKQAIDAKPSSYLTLTRTWKDGDTIKVQFPLSLHLRPARDDKSMVVVMYGPLVLAGELGTEGMPPNLVTGNNVAHLGAKTPPVPVLVDAAADPATWLKREPGEGLRFRTTGVAKPQDVTLSPLAFLHHQRYTVYWKTMTAADYTAQVPAQ